MTPDTLDRVLAQLGERADADHWRTLSRLLWRSTDARRDLDAAQRHVADLEQRLLDARAADRSAAVRAIRDGEPVEGIEEAAPAVEAELQAAREPLDRMRQAAADAETAMRRHVGEHRQAIQHDAAVTFDAVRDNIGHHVEALRDSIEAAAIMPKFHDAIEGRRTSAGFNFRHPKHLRVTVTIGGRRVEATADDIVRAASVLPFAEQIKR